MKREWCLAALAFALPIIPVPLTAGLTVGAAAPDFTESLCDENGLTGEQFSLSREGAGKVVYLQFNNPTCPGAVRLVEMVEDSVFPAFRDDPDVVFVQVAYAYVGRGLVEVTDMISGTGCTQNVLAENDGSAYDAYAITGVPHSYIIGKDGVIRFSRSGSRITAGEISGEIDALLGHGSPASPRLGLDSNNESFARGDTVLLSAELSGVSRAFDAYALIGMPDGSYLSLAPSGGLVQGVVPLAVNVPAHAFPASYRLLEGAVPPTAPSGRYEFIVSLTDPGMPQAFCEARIPACVR